MSTSPGKTNTNPHSKMTKKTTTKTPSQAGRKQARVVGFQTAVPEARDFALEWARQHLRKSGSDYAAGKLCWAKHPAEGDKPEHWHAVIEFDSVVDWSKLRSGLMALDPHSWSDSINKLSKARRYLGHRDNPLKVQIAEADIHFEGGYTEQDVAEALAPSPSAGLECLVRDLAKLVSTNSTPAAGLVHLLRSGYEPREISSVIGAFRAVDGLLSSSASRGLSRALEGPQGPAEVKETAFRGYTPDDPAFFALPDEIADMEADRFADA